MTNVPTTKTAAPQTPSKDAQPKKLIDYLAGAKFADVLPTFMREKTDAFVRLAMVDIPRSPGLAKIAQTEPRKIVAALMDCARLGLMPGPLGQVYLIPFGSEVQVITGYKGLVELARRSGEVSRVDADVIYAEDEYTYVKGDSPKFEHKPNLRSTKRTEADIAAVYAFAYDRDGRNLGGAVMPKADVDAIRARSRSGNGGPWKTDYAEMAKKTAVRRASKLWPVSTEFHEALHMDDVQEDRVPPTVQSSSAGALENRPPVVSADLYGDAPQGEASAYPSHTDDGEPIDAETGEILPRG